MNVRIPLKASSKCVESGNHTEFVGIFEIAVQVVIVLVISDLACFAALSFFGFEDVFISDFHDGVAGSNKKKIQSISVFSEEETVLFRYGKDYMSVSDVKAHGVEHQIKCTKEIKLNAKRNNVKFHSIQII